MTPARRCVVAVLGALVTLTGAALVEAPAQAATTAHYVGIVISGDKTACVKWTSGITGDAVLNAVASVHYRPSDGIIDQIDGKPNPVKTDNTHYWSYWHNTGSGWTYSSVGASSYAPKAGTVEGWNYINGSSTNTPPGNSGSYSALCGKLDKKSTTSTIASGTATHHASGPVNAHVYHPHHATTSGVRPAAGVTTAVSSVPSSSATTRSSARSSGMATRGSTTNTGAVGPVDSVVVMSGSPAADAHRVSSGSAWPTVLGVGLCALLAVGAFAGTVLRRRAARG